MQGPQPEFCQSRPADFACVLVVSCCFFKLGSIARSFVTRVADKGLRQHSIAMATVHARSQVRVYVGLTEAQSEDMLNGRNIVASYMNRWGLRPTAIAAPRRC